jgi:dATP pyrophosphohydrolase
MPKVVSDIVDVYVVRRMNARVQFMLLQRSHDVPMPLTWQACHTQIEEGEATLAAAIRAVRAYSGLNVSAAFSSDYVNQFYDETRDVLVLAPVIAVNVHPQAPVDLGEDYRDVAWLPESEAAARLSFAGQRAAVHRIAEIMGIGETESTMYKLDISAWREQSDATTGVQEPPEPKSSILTLTPEKPGDI